MRRYFLSFALLLGARFAQAPATMPKALALLESAKKIIVQRMNAQR